MAKRFFHCYKADGLILGAEVVVLAEGSQEALVIASQWAADNGVEPHTLRLMDIKDIKDIKGL